jgi:hypothetical protein
LRKDTTNVRPEWLTKMQLRFSARNEENIWDDRWKKLQKPPLEELKRYFDPKWVISLTKTPIERALTEPEDQIHGIFIHQLTFARAGPEGFRQQRPESLLA